MTTSEVKNGSVELSRKQTVRMVREWVVDRNPAAVVRFGEGEGRLLAADPADPRSERVAIRKLRRQTGLTFSPGEMFKVKALVVNALDDADVLGLRISPNFADEHKEWAERITEIYADRVALGTTPAYLAHCLLNNDLYKALPELLGEQRNVSVVSCRDIKPILEAEYGARDVAVYQLPSQHAVRDVDGAYEAAMHDIPIWPDFYSDLQAKLRVRSRGEIFLVGAGLFGKDLCLRIRQLGGIALDMGSTLDCMAGKPTRGKGRRCRGR